MLLTEFYRGSRPYVDTWKLWVVPRSKTDKRVFYRRVAETIWNEKTKWAGIDTSDTELIEQNHPATSALRSFSKVSGNGSIHIANNMLNGYHRTDGIIVLMDL